LNFTLPDKGQWAHKHAFGPEAFYTPETSLDTARLANDQHSAKPRLPIQFVWLIFIHTSEIVKLELDTGERGDDTYGLGLSQYSGYAQPATL
jgi:hypothetical protein